MLYDCKRISYWIDRRLSGLAGPDYDATISFGLPLEPGDSQYGKYRLNRVNKEDSMANELRNLIAGAIDKFVVKEAEEALEVLARARAARVHATEQEAGETEYTREDSSASEASGK